MEDIDTNRDIDKCYFIYGSSYLPNIIIYQIVEELVNDIDLICLLFTCKQFYYNFRQQYKCRFKGVSLIDQTKCSYKIRYGTLHATKSFNLRSFTDIFHRSISNQLVKSITSPLINYNNNSNNNRDDLIEKALIYNIIESNENNNDDNHIDARKMMDDLPDTIKWLIVDSPARLRFRRLTPLSLDGYKFPSQLEILHLILNSSIANVLLPETLTELTLDTPDNGLAEGLVPQSVRSLTLQNIIYRGSSISTGYHFPRHLLHLKINYAIQSPLPFPPTLLSLSLRMATVLTDFRFPSNLVSLTLYAEPLKQPLNLWLLTALETLYISLHESLGPRGIPTPSDYLRLPPNLTSLTLNAKTTIDSLTLFPNSLVSLCIGYDVISGAIDKGEQLHPALTHLSLHGWSGTLPAGFIASTVKTVKIDFNREGSMLEGAIPEGVQTLNVTSYHHNGIVQLIPQSVKHFSWRTIGRQNAVEEYFAFPSTIRTLGCMKRSNPANFQIPSSLTSLSIYAPTSPIYSGEREYDLSALYNVDEGENNRKRLLPETVSILTLEIPSYRGSHLRLDPIIYQTNVTELVIQSDFSEPICWNIQRFEELNYSINNNNNDIYDVLITEKSSLFGGIVRLGKQQTKLYLNWKSSKVSPIISTNPVYF
ncbi:hypothetical protein DFA_03160 [Cavenderia fasciculata]|uniref:Uncharacterized protein n=1 Tax=Cavenderia fasciculata TaxID=261658 RepID=F4PGT1_CACFS|nr:uncharacterized protein DFA_03160 [Cavenderia fasciculata]EGG24915.1 hypothetical protein DFA_03160 [Cavenderia fasciculata]|eukprot:XP_004362766.1 hypothetical protein DFA_03160 [Cavenderia fasciculata]